LFYLPFSLISFDLQTGISKSKDVSAATLIDVRWHSPALQ